MSDKDATTPRVYIVRHGETEWSRNGQYTGITDIDLLGSGRKQVEGTKQVMFGAGNLIDPSKLARVYVSPRKRAQTTFDILFDGDAAFQRDQERVTTTPKLAEWDYGLYEGMVTKDIRAMRKARGLDTEREWDIWTDGCEEGETSQQVSDRLDSLIGEIRAVQAPDMRGESRSSDILLVAHGHLLRAFVKRWLGYALDFPMSMMLPPGGVGILSYQHQNIEEPAIMVGMGFSVA